MLKKEKTNFYVVGIAVASVAALLLFMRIVIYLISGPLSNLEIPEWGYDLITDALFSVCVQVGVCFVTPLLIYKFAMKKSVREVFAYSNFRKTKPINFLLTLLLGIAAFFVSSGISSIWLSALEGLGYSQISSATAMPDHFDFGIFFANIVLTALLPCFCEEFANRGAFLTVLREHFSTPVVILLCGLGFGLFHANIEQFFYTACFGAMLAFVVIKTGSIFPAMIIHFTNNAISVCLSFALEYASDAGYEVLNKILGGVGFLALFVVSIIVTAVLLVIIARVNANTQGAVAPPIGVVRNYVLIDPETGVVINRSENIDELINAETANVDPFDESTPPPNGARGFSAADIDPFDESAPVPKARKLFIDTTPVKGKRFFVYKDGKWSKSSGKTIKRYETIFWIGAIVVSSLATLFSFIWGFMI